MGKFNYRLQFSMAILVYWTVNTWIGSNMFEIRCGVNIEKLKDVNNS